MNQATLRHGYADGIYWLLLYAALWGLFTEARGWLLGTVTVLLATALSLWLGLRPLRLRLAALPGFVGFFITHMFVGAWDVARRALQPQCPLQPAWLDFPLGSGSPRVRLLLSALVGLLPGTLVSRIDGDLMRVHVLDERRSWQPAMAELERHIEQLLGTAHG